MTHQGRLIINRQLDESLAAIGAERDFEGRFKIFGYSADAQPPAAFLGIASPDNEVLVNDSCYCLVDGEKINLLAVASRYDRGSAVMVIY